MTLSPSARPGAGTGPSGVSPRRRDRRRDLAQRRKEPRGVQIDRRLVDRGRRVDLGDPAVAQQRDAVAEQHGLLRIVGDDDGGRVGFAQHRQRLAAHGLAHARVEAGERLVEHQDAGARRDGARQRQPLLLAARQPVRIVVLRGRRARPGVSAGRACAERAARPSRLRPKVTFCEQRQVREQREILEHQADAAPVGRQVHARARDDLVVDPDACRRRCAGCRRRRAARSTCPSRTRRAGRRSRPAPAPG